mmetsp:Transcript_82400/g.249897  ORF Transcript_82400/g.249897 Transcript_82400/m.249897 type:complete len:385 (+) Transcript_82400:78-1232(+)
MASAARSSLRALLLAACVHGAAASRVMDALHAKGADGLLRETAATELTVTSGMEALIASLLEQEDAEASSVGKPKKHKEPKEPKDPNKPKKECKWPTELEARYTGQFKAGEGATACVFLAKDAHDQTVAVKLSKSAGRLDRWTKECSKMQRLHLEACKAGGQMLNLMETYIPTCLEVGGLKKRAYYVMQAAGTERIRYVDKAKMSRAERISVFAQLIAAVYALHGSGWSHNDLHGGNAVLDGARLALIDFGHLRALAKAVQTGKPTGKAFGPSRDGSRLWQHTAKIAKCGKAASWDGKAAKDKQQKMAEALKACLKRSWDADEAFLTTLGKVLQADIESEADQHVKELYETGFVQKHLPATDDHFKWLDAGTCQPTQGRIAGKV